MKKSFTCFLLFLFGLSLVAQTETSGRSDLYRHTPEKQTRLIHTCLKVGFDFKNRPNERRETRYDKGSRLMEDKAWSYRYDAEGNLVQKISKTQSVGRFSLLVDEVGFLTWTYAWNANGSLRSAGNNKGVYLSFEYDALGRRTAKINHQTQKIKRFLWDGNVPLHEWEYPLSERPELVSDSNGYLSYVTPEPTEDLTTWIFEEDGFVPIAKLQNGERFSIFADHLGTPVMAVNSEGKRIWECELDIYGKKRKETGVPDFIPFRYQGQYEDCETGLYYNRYRYYSPDEGMYISQDPIRLAGGSRLYGYVHDTNAWIDPFGLNEINDLGQIGETNAGIKKNTTRIPSASGKKDYRIPDAMSKNQRHITEVKNVNYQHFSSQIKDDLAHVNRGGKKGTVTLIVDNRTKLSKQLQAEVDAGRIKIKRKDLNKVGCH